jgi:hypothetical protein
VRDGALLAAALFAAAPAFAEDACGKYGDAFAYNQCLATQGPKAHATQAIDAPAGEAAATPQTRQGRVHSTVQVSRLRSGRMFAEFTVSPAHAYAGGRKRVRITDEP